MLVNRAARLLKYYVRGFPTYLVIVRMQACRNGTKEGKLRKLWIAWHGRALPCQAKHGRARD